MANVSTGGWTAVLIQKSIRENNQVNRSHLGGARVRECIGQGQHPGMETGVPRGLSPRKKADAVTQGSGS